MDVTDEMVEAAALALADEVRTWPPDASLPYNPSVGVGRTFGVLARAALEAAAPAMLAAERERIAQAIEQEEDLLASLPVDDPGVDPISRDVLTHRRYAFRDAARIARGES